MNRTTTFKHALVGISLISGTISAPIALAERDADIPNGPYHSYKHGQHYNDHRGCARYRLSAYGGEAGFRVMNNKQDFRRAANGSVVGRICSGGPVTIELSKRHPNTHVALELNGREHVFGRGDRGDRIANHWFRRCIKVNLRQRSDHGGRYTGHDADHRAHQNRYWDHEYPGKHYDDFAPYDYQGDYTHFNHDRGHGYRPNHEHHSPKPWLRVGSKRHAKAHRKGIAHRHRKQHYAYH